MRRLSSLSRGIVFIAGGTGSGKTTTLNAMVNYINRNFRRHVLTLEDPIEYIHRDNRSLVNQRELRGGDFATAMRHAVRENPDVIVLGEMRDSESVRAALNAALTGHLVLTTVHCIDTVSLPERLIGFFDDSERSRIALDLALSLEAVIAQRLISGAAGRMVPVVELLLGTPTVRKCISECAFSGLVQALSDGARHGMTTFNNSLYNLFRQKRISRTAALENSDDPDELELRFNGIQYSGGTVVAAEGAFQSAADITMNELFRVAMRLRASDLVLSHNMPPMLRINGEMMALDVPPLGSGDIRRLLFSVIERRRRALFEERRELDFSLSARFKPSKDMPEQQCRFRLNAFCQRGVPALVARVLNDRIPIRRHWASPA